MSKPPSAPALLAPEPGPTTLKSRPWGGDRLARLRAAPPSIVRPIGESWEFSTMPGSESRSDGSPLSAVLGRSLPLLAKLLDTGDRLSIQVHPDDDDATGRAGKEEAWVVLAADPGAEVLAGVRDGVDAATLAAAVRAAVAGAADESTLTSLLQRIPVETGTVVLVPAGTIHAVGAGILLAELQQASDCTLRLYDYGSGRELHVDAALAHSRIAARPGIWQPGSAPNAMRGKHLALEILGPGSHERSAADDELVVAVGPTRIRTDGTEHALPAGALRLATPGLRYRIDVPDRATVVVGALPRPR
ncbi:MAG: class I mannose-6-phosphate isomerase [Planctomycetes bacterium]|nr:class I mannose-6-phosphate isomerase [Planctomycetota bacterium]